MATSVERGFKLKISAKNRDYVNLVLSLKKKYHSSPQTPTNNL